MPFREFLHTCLFVVPFQSSANYASNQEAWTEVSSAQIASAQLGCSPLHASGFLRPSSAFAQRLRTGPFHLGRLRRALQLFGSLPAAHRLPSDYQRPHGPDGVSTGRRSRQCTLPSLLQHL